jgi:hypothetical protein
MARRIEDQSAIPISRGVLAEPEVPKIAAVCQPGHFDKIAAFVCVR